MKRIVSVLIFSVFIFTNLISQVTTDWRTGILIDEFIYEEAPFASPHAATIAETPSGLVAAWYGGTYEGNEDVSIYLSRLEDGSWTVPELVADGIQNESLRYPAWNPVLYQVPGGELQLYYKVGPSPSEWWGLVRRSSDNGLTWGEVELLPEGILGPIKNKPVLLDNGILLSGSSTENDGWKIHFEISADSGKSWIKTESINDPDQFPAIQPTILTYPDGSIQMLSRTKMAVVGESWSYDSGYTWTEITGAALPQNSSGIDGVTLADGRQMLVYNHVIPPPGEYKSIRTPLNVAISDDGEKWFASIILAEKESSDEERYSYPSVIQSADGFIHVVYTWRREKIRYVKIDPSNLNKKEIIDMKWPYDYVPVDSVIVTSLYGKDTINKIGGTVRLSATVFPGNATVQDVTWSSSDTSIATISQSGVVTGIAEGNAILCAISDDDSVNVRGCFQVNVSIPASIVSVAEQDMSIYPNPAVNEIYIRMQEGSAGSAELVILDMTGRRVKKEIVTVRDAENQISTDISGLIPGVYIIRISHSGSRSICRFIKKEI